MTSEAKSTRQLFVNLPVKDLKRAMEFFGKLGFQFNPQFTDDKAACMIVNDGAYFMLLSESYFKTFTKKGVADTTNHSECMLAFSCGSRGQVDELADVALANGGTVAMEPVDHGFMYTRSFYDLDGHHWEVLWMDPSAIQPQ